MKSSHNNISSNIILIGYRGSGKTTVAKELASITGKQYVDTDDLIKQRSGKTIAQIFSDDGESHFRQYECDVITELSQQPPAILSVGGGAVLNAQNASTLRTMGTIFYLQATANELRRRIELHKDTLTDRPALRGGSPLEEIDDLLKERAPLYESAATHVIDTTTLSPIAIATRIIKIV